MNDAPTINTGIPIINNTLNPVISESFTPNPGDSANPLQILIPIFTAIWIAGMALLLAALILTFPVPATIYYLGEPDTGAVLCGYFRWKNNQGDLRGRQIGHPENRYAGGPGRGQPL